MDELAFLTATEQADLVRRGEVTSAELVDLYLGRIERLDPELTPSSPSAASSTSRRRAVPRRAPADQGSERDRRHRTTFSSRAFADDAPDFDTAVVRRLKDAGFVVPARPTRPSSG